MGGLSALGNPEELWRAFKTTILDVAGGCLGTHRRAKKNFVSQGTLDSIDQSCRARFNGRAELFRELRRKTVRVLRVDKEADVQGIYEGVELFGSSLNADESFGRGCLQPMFISLERLIQ